MAPLHEGARRLSEPAGRVGAIGVAGVTSLQGYLFQRPCPVSEIDFDVIFGAPAMAEVA